MLAGESNATTTEAFPGVTLVIVGAPGAAAGVVGSEGSSAFVVPALLVADKVQVYVLPLVSPLTVIGDAAPVLLPGAPPSIDVHETENDCVLPLSAPAVNATVIELSPPLALVITGAPGGAAGTTAGEAAEGPLVSSRMFVAVTVHVYVLPLVRPETAIGDETPSRLPDVPPLDDVHDAVNDAIARAVRGTRRERHSDRAVAGRDAGDRRRTRRDRERRADARSEHQRERGAENGRAPCRTKRPPLPHRPSRLAGKTLAPEAPQ